MHISINLIFGLLVCLSCHTSHSTCADYSSHVSLFNFKVSLWAEGQHGVGDAQNARWGLLKLARWHVAQIVPGQDATFRFYLDLLGFQVFLPKILERNIITRLYPGYGFVRFGDLDFWQRINSSPGVIKLLPVNQEKPVPLPDGFVENLQSGIEGGGFTRAEADELVDSFLPGRVVKVEDGPFYGHQGSLVRHERGAVVLLLSLFGRSFEAKFAKHQVAA